MLNCLKIQGGRVRQIYKIGPLDMKFPVHTERVRMVLAKCVRISSAKTLLILKTLRLMYRHYTINLPVTVSVTFMV